MTCTRCDDPSTVLFDGELLCADHAHDLLTDCAGDCGRVIWQADGWRLYDSSSLYCQSCASQHPVWADDVARQSREDLRRGK